MAGLELLSGMDELALEELDLGVGVGVGVSAVAGEGVSRCNIIQQRGAINIDFSTETKPFMDDQFYKARVVAIGLSWAEEPM